MVQHLSRKPYLHETGQRSWNFRKKKAIKRSPPLETLLPTTDVVILGLHDYLVQPHQPTTKKSRALIGELRRTLGMKGDHRPSSHSLSNWEGHGIQIMRLDGIHTFNMLRTIRWKCEKKMAVILMGAEANKFLPAIEDAPDHILVMPIDIPSVSGGEYRQRFYGSDVFRRVSDHLGRSVDMWRIN